MGKLFWFFFMNKYANSEEQKIENENSGRMNSSTV